MGFWLAVTVARCSKGSGSALSKYNLLNAERLFRALTERWTGARVDGDAIRGTRDGRIPRADDTTNLF